MAEGGGDQWPAGPAPVAPAPPSTGKAIAVVVALLVLAAALYVVFVPKLVEREIVREARYEIVDESWDVTDHALCVETHWLWGYCTAWSDTDYWRYFSAQVKVRAIEEAGDYIVTYRIDSGPGFAGSKETDTRYIGVNQITTFEFDWRPVQVSGGEHDDQDYTTIVGVSAPKTVEHKQLTLFESLFE